MNLRPILWTGRIGQALEQLQVLEIDQPPVLAATIPQRFGRIAASMGNPKYNEYCNLLCRRLRQLRIDSTLKQHEFSELHNFPLRTLQRIEEEDIQGIARLRTLHRLAVAFNMPIQTMMRVDGVPLAPAIPPRKPRRKPVKRRKKRMPNKA
jgi:hypothetical protein